MISFDLSDEHKEVERTVRQWGAAEVAPQIHDLDRAHRFERKFLDGMADLQLLGICIPEEYGGAGLEYIKPGVLSQGPQDVGTPLRARIHVGPGPHRLPVTRPRRGVWDEKDLGPPPQG